VDDPAKPPKANTGLGWLGRIAHTAGCDRRGHSKIFSSLLGLLQAPATSLDVLGMIGAFHERHPGIRFQITTSSSTEMAAAVAGEGLDVALVGIEAADAPTGVECVRLACDPLVAIVSAKNPLAGRRRIALADLAEGGQFIHFRRGSGLRDQVDAAFARAGLTPAGSFEMGLITDMIELAARDVGVTIVPRTALTRAGEINGVRFSAPVLNDEQARHPVSVAYNPARLSIAAKAFVDELVCGIDPQAVRQIAVS
jgi:DNA-binding transcriptional LysR family regulator